MGTKGQWNGKFKRGIALLLTAAMILSTDLSSFAANISENSTTEEETSNQNTLVDILQEEVSQDEASQDEVSQNQPSQDTTEDEIQETNVSENQTQEVDAHDNEIEESLVGSGSMKLEVSCVTYNKAKLTWEAVSGADAYIISRKVSSLNGSSNFENIKTLGKKSKSFVDSRLSNGETYYYKVEAATKSGRDYTSFDVSAEVPVDIKIAAPLESKSTAVIDKKNRIIIKWPKVSGAEQYKLSRLVKGDQGDKWESIIDLSKYNEDVNPYKKNSYIDNVDATTVDSYVYQLIASRRDESGTWIDSEETIIVCTPSVLMANNDGDKDTMGVTYTSIMGCSEYEVQRSFNSTKVVRFEEVEVVSNTDGKVTSSYNGDRIVSASSNGIAVEKYLDDGGKYAPLSNYFGESFYYRVRAVAQVPDGEGGTKIVYSPYSKALKSTVAMEAPTLVSVNCVSYNKANVTIKVSDNKALTSSDYLVFYRSNKLNTGYKQVKRVKARDKSVVYDDANNTISYALAGFTPENTYYLKVAVIKRGFKNSSRKTVAIQTEKSNFLLAKTVYEDVKKVTVKSADYNAMSVSFNKIPGATKYNVYYTTSIGSVSDNSTWVWAKRPILINSKGDKKGVVTYTRKGYKHGQYVAMYAVPISGKLEHQQTMPQYTPDYTRIKTPTLTLKSVGPWKIRASFTKLTGAQYYYLEYYTRQTNGTYLLEQKFKLTSSQLKTSGKNYYYDIGDTKNTGVIETGKKYFFKVSAYCTKDNVSGPGDATDYKACQARPKVPTKLKAVYSDNNEGALLTWTKGDGATGYRILRAYNGSKYVEICPYTTSTSYTDTSSDLTSARDGKMYKYKVYSISKDSDVDEYSIASEKYAKCEFCNPSSIDVSSQTIGKGSSVTVKVKFSPSETTAKGIKSWKITKGEDYVDLTKDSGDSATFKGVKKGTATVEVISDNDKRDTFTIKVTELTVCLDPGHGGDQSGAVYGGYTEKERNLKISYYTKKRLEEKGISVVMTRTDDYRVGLEERAIIAKEKGCNLFVSQHLNATDSHNEKGTEVYYSVNSTYARYDLAKKISSKVSSAIATNDRGAKTRLNSAKNGDYYTVIDESAKRGIPALIVEAAFLDSEYSKLNDAGCEAIGKATADAIYDYFY